MDNNYELLSFVYQNSYNRINYINQFLEVVQDKNFSNFLCTQLNEYTDINKKSEKKLKKIKSDSLPATSVSSVAASLGAIFSTLVDKSPAHISEMMLENNSSSVIEIIKKKNEHKDADEETISLTDKLLKCEEKSIIELKKFLC